nr:MAG: hypothetical protein ACHINZ_6030 [Candidatus Aschnera chinzeii]
MKIKCIKIITITLFILWTNYTFSIVNINDTNNMNKLYNDTNNLFNNINLINDHDYKYDHVYNMNNKINKTISFNRLKDFKSINYNDNNSSNMITKRIKRHEHKKHNTKVVLQDTIMNDIINTANKFTDETTATVLATSNTANNNNVIETNSTIRDTINELDKNIEKQLSTIEENVVNKAAKDTFAGIASAVASSSIPYISNKIISFGVGLGHYKTGNAISTGFQYNITSNGCLRINAMYNNSHYASLGGGFSIKW